MNWDTGLALVAAGVTLFIGVLTWLNHRRANRTTEAKVEAETQHSLFADQMALTEYIDARVEKVVKPVRDALDEERTIRRRRDGAFGRILRAIAKQWSGAEGGPDLDPADIAEVEETIPAQWIRGGGAPKRT